MTMAADERVPSPAIADMHGYAVVFIDYENVYYHLSTAYADIPELNDFVIDLLMSLQRRLEERFGVRPIISKAYADFERLRSTPQGSLYLMGVETTNVLGTDHKNAADMKLCIDAMEVLYTRPEIQCFVIFAGDRDYIPLIQHLKKQAKTVVCVGFEGSFSGDLMLNVGREYFIGAVELFPPERLARLEEVAKRYNDYLLAEREREEQRAAEQTARKRGEIPANAAVSARATSVPELPAPAASSVTIMAAKPSVSSAETSAAMEEEGFNPITPDISEDERVCLEVMIRNYGNYSDIFLTPFLRKLSDALPSLADWERKALLPNLEAKGALRLAKRRGKLNDYTVVVLNHNHPAVRKAWNA